MAVKFRKGKTKTCMMYFIDFGAALPSTRVIAIGYDFFATSFALGLIWSFFPSYLIKVKA